MRTYFHDQPFTKFSFEVNNRTYTFSEEIIFAEIAYPQARINHTVFKFDDGKYIHLIVVDEEDKIAPYGIHKGWYSAEEISEERALLTKKSWSLLRRQPEK